MTYHTILRRKFYFLVILIFGIFSCKTANKDTPAIDHLKINTEIKRFDLALFQVDTLHMKDAIQKLLVEYPGFGKIFFNKVLYNDPVKPLPIDVNLKAFLRDTFIQNLYNTVEQQYEGKFPSITKEFNLALAYLKYYFPERNTPTIVSYISAYNYAAFTVGEDTLAFNLDMFLGKDHRGYDPNILPEYLKNSMQKEFIIIKSMQSYVQNLIIESKDQRMLDMMILQGKILYIVEKLLPFKPSYMIHEYTENQWNWCNQNEAEIWKLFIDKNLIYNRKLTAFAKFIYPSPHSPYMPSEAPGQTGNFIGYKIVQKYMERNPELSLQNLLDELDAEKILKESKYRPK